MQTSRSWVNAHSFTELFRPDDNYYFPRLLEEVHSITKRDLVRVSNKYFKKDFSYVAMCGNIKASEVTLNW